MTYVDNECKFICVLNKKTPTPLAMNALAHVTVGLASMLSDGERDLLEYVSRTGEFTSLISRWPFIVLQAKNSNQLRQLQQSCSIKNLPFNAFTSSMVGASAMEQISKTAALDEEQLEFWAVAVFGTALDLAEPTKRFSLYK